MRTDVSEISYAAMTPMMRAMVCYESNGALDQQCPQGEIARMAQTSPVVRWEQGVAFFTMADIVTAGNHPNVVSTDPVSHEAFGMGSREPLIPLHVDGDAHRHYRKLLDPLLAPRQVAHLEPRLRQLADETIDRFIDRGSVEFHDEFAVPLPGTMFMEIFGAPMSDYELFVSCKDEILKNCETTLEAREAVGRVAGDRMRDRLRELLAERRASSSGADDLIERFLTFEVDGHRLGDDDIVNIMHLFVIAGLDTVTSSLTCIVAWLAEHPEERRRVMADPSKLAQTIEELMRFESPVGSGGPRWATEDIDINGVPVAEGQMIYLGWASANLDPAVFDRPLEVQLDREHNRHVGFAAGRHRCLGSHLARLELRTAIDQFHRRLSDYWVSPGERTEYQHEGVRQAVRLPLELTAR